MTTDTPLLREAKPERASIPPLSQSRYGDMACEMLNVHKHIQRARTADSAYAARGIEIHRILAAYLNHLVKTRRATDIETLDFLVKWQCRDIRGFAEISGQPRF